MLKRISHIALAVADLDGACDFYRDIMGAEIRGREIIPGQQSEVAFVQLPDGDTRLELIAPTGEDSPVARFLSRKGPGIHHICYQVDDLAAALKSLQEQGLKLVDAEPRRGAGGEKIAFLHPASAMGVLIELTETQR